MQGDYSFTPTIAPAPPSPPARRNVPYGFFPPDFELEEASTAFWPEVTVELASPEHATSCSEIPFPFLAARLQWSSVLQCHEDKLVATFHHCSATICAHLHSGGMISRSLDSPTVTLKDCLTTSTAEVQARTGAKGPVEAAAAFARASKQPQRVTFNAACRVVVPTPPEDARVGVPDLRPAHKPAWQTRRTDKQLPVEVSQRRLHTGIVLWARNDICSTRSVVDSQRI